MEFFTSRVRKTKPSFTTEIDWENDLTENLKHLFILNEDGGPPFDLVTKTFFSNIVGSPYGGVDETGKVLESDGNDSYWGTIPAYQHPVTIAALMSKVDKSISSSILGLGQNTGLGGLFVLSPRSTAHNDIRSYVRSTGGEAISFAAGTPNYDLNRNYFIASTVRDPNHVGIWVDGELSGETAGSHGSTITWTRLTLMGLTRNIPNASHNGTLSFAGVWNDAFTDEKHRRLAENPFQVLKKIKRYSPALSSTDDVTVAPLPIVKTLLILPLSVLAGTEVNSQIINKTLVVNQSVIELGTEIDVPVISKAVTVNNHVIVASVDTVVEVPILEKFYLTLPSQVTALIDIDVAPATIYKTLNILPLEIKAEIDTIVTASTIFKLLTILAPTISAGEPLEIDVFRIHTRVRVLKHEIISTEAPALLTGDINETVPHSILDSKEQQRVLIENFILVKDRLENLEK